MARDGRGRLNSLELLPEDAQEDVRWALAELAARSRTQIDIRDELNTKLAEKGYEPISPSAFNRASMRKAKHTRALAERNELIAGMSQFVNPETIDEGNIVICEMIKNLITEKLDAETAEISPKMTLELARAHLATIQAQGLSKKNRQTEIDRFKGQAAAAIEEVAQKMGLSSEAVETIRRGVLEM